MKCTKCDTEGADITCESCSSAVHKDCSRKYKGKRYCHKCYKKISKEERTLRSLAS